jgi:NitT/TauT family transport system permease protein
VLPPFQVPGWQRIISRLVHLPWDFVAISLARVIGALAVAFALGVVMSLGMLGARQVERYGMPIIKLLMAVPATCWILFAVLWFKHVEVRIAFVLITVCFPIFLIDLLDAMKGVSKDLRDMFWSLRPSRLQYCVKLLFPAVVPAMLTSWKINLSLAIRVVTFAELVGAVSGIGYGLVVAQELFSVADVFAWTLVLIVVLLVFQGVLETFERRLLRWRA